VAAMDVGDDVVAEWSVFHTEKEWPDYYDLEMAGNTSYLTAGS
jgi:hypothetical protein